MRGSTRFASLAVFLVCSALVVPLARGGEAVSGGADGAASGAPDEASSLLPKSVVESGINWRGVLLQSLTFLTIEHGFRYATEAGTRQPHDSFFGGYVDSLHNLHGWADGDPFYVNYVGHPMQGSVAGYIFTQNDRAYRKVEFGKNPAYWKSRLRATAFSWAYSELFEIGPISEASIGNTQAFYPQQGFVDQVVTPAIGLVWMLAEDSVDKYLIKRLEQHTSNPFITRAARAGLNPSRSLAYMLSGRMPWYRDSRPYPGYRDTEFQPRSQSVERGHRSEVTTFEFLASARIMGSFERTSRGACLGGGAAAAFRVAPHWQLVGDVDGCKLTGFGPHISGDSLLYLGGPRWTPRPADRWQPFAHVLIGGRKMTHERVLEPGPTIINALTDAPPPYPDQRYGVQFEEVSGLVLGGGVGVDLKLSPAIGIRVGQLDYLHSWHARLGGISYTDTARFTSGLVIRFGTW